MPTPRVPMSAPSKHTSVVNPLSAPLGWFNNVFASARDRRNATHAAWSASEEPPASSRSQGQLGPPEPKDMQDNVYNRLLKQISPAGKVAGEEPAAQDRGEEMVRRLKRELESRRGSWEDRLSDSREKRTSQGDSWGSGVSSELDLERKSKRESLEKYMMSKDFTAEVGPVLCAPAA